MPVARRAGRQPAAVRAALRRIAPNLPAYSVLPLDEHVTRSLARERLMARLLSVFGAIALIIAAVGIYGALAARFLLFNPCVPIGADRK